MGRFPQSRGRKGSKKWIQTLINEQPELLTTRIKANFGFDQSESICWLSPLEEDCYAEYRDQAFLKRLDVSLDKVPLAEFWPRGGPQWDALGRSSENRVFLIEGKSHISELVSSLRAKDQKSREKVLKSLECAKRSFGSSVGSDWSSPYYQYANRLAHLFLLRELNCVAAYLVFVYFTNDIGMGGPKTAVEWKSELERVHSHLGIGRHSLEKFVSDIFIDVGRLAMQYYNNLSRAHG